nr:putative leucine-rich repeat receptor-like serine/threonine-protein kinase [Quercus suber]
MKEYLLRKANMDGASNLEVWLLFVVVIAILGNSAGNNQYAARKLDDEIPGFISIDCGSDEDYTDKETGIPYKSDKELIDTGIVNTIPADSSTNLAQYLKSLRSFPQGKRNCYTLRPEQGKNNNYLIRARFFYGNYDGKDQAPTFDLHIGVNLWRTVDIEEVSDSVIYVPLTDYIDLCLVNTGNGIPYISALELRLLENSIYHTAGGALTNPNRYDIGRSGQSELRYPDDVYDRYWHPKLDDDWVQVTTSSTINSQNANNIPDVVLRTAAQSQNASIPLNFSWSPPDSLSKCYVYFHFAEIEKLEAGQQRELTINLNGQHYLTESIKLDYLNPITIVQTDQASSGQQLYFSISAAKGTKLPPILNAVEIFELKELPNKPTAIDDVEAIMEIKEWYKVTKNWQGDPCVPREFSWDGLNCSNNNPPRIISLDLSYNELMGSLPEFLAQLWNLNTLDLSGNKLTGSVPEVLLKMSSDRKLILSVGENPDLCLSDPCKRKKKKLFVIPVVVSSIAAVLVLLFIFSALAIYRRKKHEVTKSIIKSQNQRYSYSEVVSITNNFKTIIGEGGFGKVYLGKLKDETQVAVKFLSTSSYQGYKEFRAEAQLLMIVHHRNLVSLVGYCDEGEKKALIYEYMANGNLHQHLSERI